MHSILYLGSIIDDSIEDEYNLGYYSRAGDNKKRGIIAALTETGTEVTVVAPLLVNNNSGNWYRRREFVDEELGTTVHIPSVVDIYGLNYIWLALSTTYLVIRLLLSRSYTAIMFYDFSLETALPSLVARLLLDTNIILEYEDGLFYHDNRVIRWSAELLRRVCNPVLDGAICVNTELESLLSTENTVIVRGFPSVGMPDDLPEPSFQQEKPVVMFAGRMDEVRGASRFLDVVEELDETEFQFWMCGYGSEAELERYEKRAEDVGNDQLRFFGTLPWEEYRDRVVSADVLVNFQDPDHPISRYTFPSKLLDFLSAGSVVVSTDMSDLRRCLDDELVVAGKSQGELVAELERIHRRGVDEYEEYGFRGQTWIRNNCSQGAVSEKVNRVIDAA
jgi:glycosyltransferase involved in cell wall biosynthesis